MLRSTIRVSLFALTVVTLALPACGGGGSAPSPAVTPTPAATLAPTPTATPTAAASPTPTASPTPAITATPTQTQTPVPSPLTVTYTTTYQSAQATPYPGSAPIQLFAQGQSAVLTVTGGTPPYAGQVLYCTSGAGFGAPFTFMQNANQTFTLTATQYAGSCAVYIADSSNPFKSLQMQATLTTTTGQVQ